MAFHLFEDTWEISTTTGTGDYTLGGAVTGWRAFSSQFSDGDTTHYSAYDGTNFEHGVGTFHSATPSLTRTTVYRSSNANAAVNWGVGTRQITCAPLGFDFEGILSSASTGFLRKSAAAASGAPATWAYDAAGQMLGTATNDSASAGNVGEYISSSIIPGAGVSLTSGSPANITSISLTAGDWDVAGNVVLDTAGSPTVTAFLGGISQTSATIPTDPGGGSFTALVGSSFVGSSTDLIALCLAPSRASLSGTTTVYLVIDAIFTGGSSISGHGFIGARRAR